MPKYKNAKDLLDEAMSNVEVKVINGDGIEGNLENAVTITDLISIAGYLYPADFVQVVRCKDCKHRFESDVYFPNNCCDLTHLAIKPTDYCSNAERIPNNE